jgi:uncharacterized protein (TIGR04255 family)
MSDTPEYKRPPVGEALIDIRVDPLPPDYLQRLDKLHDKVSRDYPTKKVRHSFEGSIQIEGGTVVTSPVTSGPFGYWFESKDNKKIIQVRLDGFTYNSIKADPYEAWPGWNTMRNEAMQAWKLYAETLSLVELTRFAVRYINRIVIPGSSVELYDYFTVTPRIPSDFPYQDMLNFSSSVTISIPDHKALAIVKQAPALNPHPGTTSIILDIDVFRNERVRLNEFPLWETLDKLRDLKNKIFETSLLPKAKELFK